MEKPLKRKADEPDKIRVLKHEIRNQLSNVQLALDQLNYEIPDASPDCTFYIEAIAMSCAKIDSLLKETD
jgi:nitrogen-specific signal transduction histidine kinase